MAVTATRPGFWLQHASNEARQLVALAAELAQLASGRPGISFGPLNTPGTLNNLFERARLAGNAVLDPHGYFVDRAPTERARQHFPWLVAAPRPASQPQWEHWMQDAMDHQLSAALRGSAPRPSFVIRGTAHISPKGVIAVLRRSPQTAALA